MKKLKGVETYVQFIRQDFKPYAFPKGDEWCDGVEKNVLKTNNCRLMHDVTFWDDKKDAHFGHVLAVHIKGCRTLKNQWHTAPSAFSKKYQDQIESEVVELLHKNVSIEARSDSPESHYISFYLREGDNLQLATEIITSVIQKYEGLFSTQAKK